MVLAGEGKGNSGIIIHPLRSQAMSVPDSIRALKPTGFGRCKIQTVNGKYYVYEVHSLWDTKEKRKKTRLGKCLGKITEADGFIPNGYAVSRHSDDAADSAGVRVLHFGAYELFRQLAPETEEDLRRFFPDRFREIRTLALTRLIDRAVPKYVEEVFLRSYLSEFSPDLAMSEMTVRGLVTVLGQDVNLTERFMQASITAGAQLVFDGTHFFAEFRDSLSRRGYNPDHSTRRQIRVLYVFDWTTKRPQFYQVFPGSQVDKTAFIEVVRASGCRDCVVIADKGFYSKKNAAALLHSNLHIEYILPLQKNTKLIKKSFYEAALDDSFDGIFLYSGRTIYYTSWQYGSEGNNIYAYYDPVRAAHERSRALAGSRDGHFAFISNIEAHSREVYELYKDRQLIEDMFDYLKNIIDVGPSYAHNDAYVRGWAFINHISLL